MVRERRLELPWKQRMGIWWDKPLEKLAVAGDASVPPAPGVNMSVDTRGGLTEVKRGVERTQDMGLGSNGIERL